MIISAKNLFSSPEKVILWTFSFFCALIPFQFALNPGADIDLAAVRVLIPILFIICFFAQYKKKNISVFNNRTTFFIIIFGALCLFSLSFSFNISWSIRKFFFLLSIVPIYFVAISVMQSMQSQRTIMRSLVLGATALSFLALAQFFSQFIFGINPVYDFLAHNTAPFFLGHSFANAVLSYPSWLVSSEGTNFMRAVATFPDPHMLSYYLGMLLPWALALGATSKKNAFWFYLAALLLFLADICTFTRGGYIALIVGSFTSLPLVSKPVRIKIISVIFLTLAFYLIAPHSPVASRLTSSFDVQEGSNQGRLTNWQQALLIIKKHPLGVGIGMYPLAVDSAANYREPIYAHNLYLDIAAELGIFAAIIFLSTILLAVLSFWSVAKKEPFFVAGVVSIIIFSIHSLVETPLYSVHLLPLFLIILALSTLTKKYVAA